MTLDPKRRLVMATFKTVLGHGLAAGTPLAVVDEPSARGEIDQALANRLFASGNAIYAEDHRPTPVETAEQEKARLARDALRDAAADQLVPTDDLVTWLADDLPLNKKAGDKVTNEDLRAIAAREGVAVSGRASNADLARLIMERRAAVQPDNSTNAGSGQGVVQDGEAGSGSTGAGEGEGAGGGAGGGE